MSYCRFQNTLSNLEDCYNHLHDENLSSEEKECRDKLFELCAEIVS